MIYWFKNIFTVSCFVSFLLFAEISIAQTSKKDSSDIVTTIGVIDIRETKSGYRINDYHIELTKRQLDSLKGKKVIVSGKLLIIEGLDSKEKIHTQGALNDCKFILHPKFTIVYDTPEPIINH